MDCRSIGQANPDIAGTGILVAFVIQSLIAVVTSGYAWILSSIIQQRWNAADPDPQSSSNGKTPEWLRSFLAARNAVSNPTSFIRKFLAYKNSIFYRIWENQKVKRSHALNWLVGKQPAQPRQRTRESNIDDEITPTTRRLEFANRILLAGSDSQTFTGIALLISALIQAKTLTLYHMHIIYDTISLVIISNCAASVCIFREGRIKGYTRLILIAIWTVLFIAYFSVFATRLQKWDIEIPTHCYKTTTTALPNASHPYVDNIYIAVTFVFIWASICYAVSVSLTSEVDLDKKRSHMTRSVFELPFLTGITESRISEPSAVTARNIQLMLQSLALTSHPATDMQYAILSIAMLQCPLHIYSIFALRASNERYMEDGSSEQNWGFGQIAAMVLLGGNLLQIVDGVLEYRMKEVPNAQRNRDEEHLAGTEMIVQDVAQDGTEAGASLAERDSEGSTSHEHAQHR